MGTFLIGLDMWPRRCRCAPARVTKAGVKVVRLPARSPNLNAYAERFVLTVKAECLERMVLLGEWHLRQAISESMRHFNEARPHQGIGQRITGSRRELPMSQSPSWPSLCSEGSIT